MRRLLFRFQIFSVSVFQLLVFGFLLITNASTKNKFLRATNTFRFLSLIRINPLTLLSNSPSVADNKGGVTQIDSNLVPEV